MIRSNKTPGIHLLKNDHSHAPKRAFGKEMRNQFHEYASRENAYHHRHQNRSLRTLPSANDCREKPDKKGFNRNDSQKVIRSSYNPESLDTTGANLNSKVAKLTLSRDQSLSNSPHKIDDETLEEYLRKRAPRAISEIDQNFTISESMRKHVTIWLIELFHGAKLKPESLFHCIYLFDYMLSPKSSFMQSFTATVENLQLLAVTCFLISTKYEEIYPPTVKKCVEIADFTYSKAKILDMEAQILLANQFCLTFPTRVTFLQHLIPQDNKNSKSKRLYHLTLYLLQISLMSLWEDAAEDEISNAAVFLAQKVLQMEVENPSRKICQLAWKLMKIWKSNKGGVVSLIFDSDRYSFVGGIYLDGI